MCDTKKNVTKIGVIEEEFTKVCFDMTEWHHVKKGHGLCDINHHEHGFQWTLLDFHHCNGKTHHCH